MTKSIPFIENSVHCAQGKKRRFRNYHKLPFMVGIHVNVVQNIVQNIVQNVVQNELNINNL